MAAHRTDRLLLRQNSNRSFHSRSESSEAGDLIACRLKPNAGFRPWGVGRIWKWPPPGLVAAPRLLAALWLVLAPQSQACGPEFPNSLLVGGDNAVLVAPVVNFERELRRMDLVQTRLHAVQNSKNSHAKDALNAESADLGLALKKAGVSAADSSKTRHLHAAARTALDQFVAQWADTEPIQLPASVTIQPPKMENLAKLPAEFADYLEGAAVWYNPAEPDKTAARAAWQRVLARPRAQRQFKSTWAAYMLGRSWAEARPQQAMFWFRRVRELARDGFADSLGLAAASLGQEARIRLRNEQFEPAIALYLEQFATGDNTALNSLRIAARECLDASPEALAAAARNPITQKVVTAFLLSQPASTWMASIDVDADTNSTPTQEIPALTGAQKWLAAIEAADIKDVDSAEKLALAAYRANEMPLAQRWIERAPTSPIAQWLQAKLWLRAGKISDAAALLAELLPQFPIDSPGGLVAEPGGLKDSLFMDNSGSIPERIAIERQVRGEFGVLQLNRGDYVQALDALLNGGFWMDAAYVAERVLTLDELKNYVDHYWPAAPPAESDRKVADTSTTQPIETGSDEVTETESEPATSLAPEDYDRPSEVAPGVLREQIRYLLARRLTRSIRGDEARPYYPANWVPAFDQLAKALLDGWNEALPNDQRVQGLFDAAHIARTNGMELLGTEMEPDWHIFQGNFEGDLTVKQREANPAAHLIVAGPDELARGARHNADPEQRFHYRYQAAFLAWEAAKYLPNDSEQTALVLWTGGSFLKNRDPLTADLFYKSLVRRNRHTALGAEADRRRWFPELDENGRVIPLTRRPSLITELTQDVIATDAADASADASTTTSDAKEMRQPLTEETNGPAERTSSSSEEDTAAPETTKGYEYVVQKGDTLALIAQAFTDAGALVSAVDILQANALADGRLKVGQRLFIPILSKPAVVPTASE